MPIFLHRIRTYFIIEIHCYMNNTLHKIALEDSHRQCHTCISAIYIHMSRNMYILCVSACSKPWNSRWKATERLTRSSSRVCEMKLKTDRGSWMNLRSKSLFSLYFLTTRDQFNSWILFKKKSIHLPVTGDWSAKQIFLFNVNIQC